MKIFKALVFFIGMFFYIGIINYTCRFATDWIEKRGGVLVIFLKQIFSGGLFLFACFLIYGVVMTAFYLLSLLYPYKRGLIFIVSAMLGTNLLIFIASAFAVIYMPEYNEDFYGYKTSYIILDVLLIGVLTIATIYRAKSIVDEKRDAEKYKIY